MRSSLVVSTVVAVCTSWAVTTTSAEMPANKQEVGRASVFVTHDGRSVPRRDDRIATFKSDADGVRFIDAQILQPADWSQLDRRQSCRLEGGSRYSDWAPRLQVVSQGCVAGGRFP